ncbi:MAG: hypothetical protein KDM64_10915 [Verrucomicrobiae bacterium]|nr:hypothetical protein [Verrucomicrobiae bacterium]MCB1092192.1 hypothetical protein [Verrucomicrobiae bacterium]
MKKLIALVLALGLSGAAYAGCGVKVAVDGKLSKFDAEKKELTVGKQTITLAASAVVKGADGKEAKIEDLVGKEVNVSTDKHTKKAEAITAKS